MYMEPTTESMSYPKYTYQMIYETLKEYGIQGELYLEYPVKSKLLGVQGYVDAIIIHNNREYTLVEVKNSISRRKLNTSHRHFRIQLITYMLAAEETLKRKTNSIIVLSLENHKLIKLMITPWEINEAIKLIKQIWKTVKTQVIPNRTTDKWKCKTCQYKKLCNLI